ncbi:MAG TPA: hypothetical protein VEK78_03075 [Gemmatimonadales bacterium]|nr:hypothetical protein [Gemmatimonadales bacterium]
MSDSPAPRRRVPPLMDNLGKLCVQGRQLAEYLWQVPSDVAVRAQILGVIDQVAAEGKKQGRREMLRICDELRTAAKASPSSQQVDVLVNGFHRLMNLWQAAKSGLL